MIPAFPAIVATRILISIVVILLGFLGFAIWIFFEGMIARLSGRTVTKTRHESGEAQTTFPKLGRFPVMDFLPMIAVGILLISQVIYGIRDIVNDNNKRISETYPLDISQVALLTTRDGGCGTVVYNTKEVSIFFYLTHGALQCGAIYYPAVAGTSQASTWFEQANPPLYLVMSNPVTTLAAYRKHGLQVSKGEYIDVIFDQAASISSVRLLVDNTNQTEVHLALKSHDAATITLGEVTIPANWSGWMRFSNTKDLTVSRFSLEVQDSAVNVSLGGIRIRDDTTLNWPWNQGVTLSVKSRGTETDQEVQFLTEVVFDKKTFSFHVLSDSGSDLLAELDPIQKMPD